MTDSTIGQVAMEAARRIAERTFRTDPDRETKVADAVSVAWEFSQTPPPEATAGTIAVYAVRRVKTGRQFPRSVRSIDGPPVDPGRKNPVRKPTRVLIDLGDLASCGDDPAVIAAVRHDTRVWWGELSKRKQTIAAALAQGCSTGEAAVLAGVSDARVSQVRRELHDSYQTLHQ